MFIQTRFNIRREQHRAQLKKRSFQNSSNYQNNKASRWLQNLKKKGANRRLEILCFHIPKENTCQNIIAFHWCLQQLQTLTIGSHQSVKNKNVSDYYWIITNKWEKYDQYTSSRPKSTTFSWRVPRSSILNLLGKVI